jgi:5-methylcytosine-specific restriction endonuclease McrA
MEDYFISYVTGEELKKERAKSRELRNSQWWKRRLSEGRCYYCGKEFSPGELSMDHVVPLIRGGKSTKGNVVPACKVCNNKKKHLLPSEWDEYLEHLREDED